MSGAACSVNRKSDIISEYKHRIKDCRVGKCVRNGGSSDGVGGVARACQIFCDDVE